MITEIFYDVDNFCQKFTKEWLKTLLSSSEMKPQCSRMVMSEIMTIVILYHSSGYKCFKYFYIRKVLCDYKTYFPNIVSYSRFIELMPSVMIPLLHFLQSRMSECTDISYIDSTKIAVCNNKRITSNKVFKNVAKIGKGSMGWFYGFKVHLIVSEKGDLLAFNISQGNKSDKNRLLVNKMCENLSGKLFADNGYVSSPLRKELKEKDVTLVTRVNANMKNKLMTMEDRILLNKRGIIETINDQIKNLCNIEHTRHRSVYNFFVNILSGLVNYTFFQKKPSIKISVSEKILMAS